MSIQKIRKQKSKNLFIKIRGSLKNLKLKQNYATYDSLNTFFLLFLFFFRRKRKEDEIIKAEKKDFNLNNLNSYKRLKPV